MKASAPNNTEHKEAHLPPHQRKSVTQIPVTPGVSLGTYDEDYFDDASQESPAPQTNGITDGQVGFTGNIISATFEVPHTLEYRPGLDWVSVVNRRYLNILTNGLFYRSYVVSTSASRCSTHCIIFLKKALGITLL